MIVKRYKTLFFGIMLLTLIISSCSQKAANSFNYPEINVYKSSSCGCCGIYVQYLQNNGLNVNVITMDVDQIKKDLSIPSDMQSCHTSKIGDYFVEGHVPLEAIEKLLTEKPNIKGIALPGMPSGSPGMAGSKQGEWIIYKINNDSTTSEFMRL